MPVLKVLGVRAGKLSSLCDIFQERLAKEARHPALKMEADEGLHRTPSPFL